MNRHRFGGVLAVLAIAASACTVALAQGPGGGFGGRGGFGGGMMGGMAQPSAATIALPLLQINLKLSADQPAQIYDIQNNLEDARILAQPPQVQGQRPTQDEMQAYRDKVKQLTKDADAKIAAVLATDDQKAALAKLITDEGNSQADGIPVEANATLNLTQDQTDKLSAVATTFWAAAAQAQAGGNFRAIFQARNQARTDAQAVLTDDQKAALTQYLKDHPRLRTFMAFGGGRGGQRGGQRGGGQAGANGAAFRGNQGGAITTAVNKAGW